tara:strand:- start:9 stop:1325 length:1317 start_codon:yes stop_codon:yes gene_type:complete
MSSYDRVVRAAEELAIEARRAGVDAKQLIDGEQATEFARLGGRQLPQDVAKLGLAQQQEVVRAQLSTVPAEWRGEYHDNASRLVKEVEHAKRTGRAPPPSERPIGVICGDEAPPERARMWIALALAPSGKAVLGGQCSWLTQNFIGYDALMKGSNADALECMCALLGLGHMLAPPRAGDGDHADETACVGAVASALGKHASPMAASLCQWLAHQPVGQDYMYGGDWKRPHRSSDKLLMSPLLTSEPALKMMNSLLLLLWLMCDPQTEELYGCGRAFTRACVASCHFPAALRRLVQLTARHDDPELRRYNLPSLALQSLDALCTREPAAAALLHTHARASDVLRPIAKVGADEPTASQLQQEHGPAVRRLLRLTLEALTDANAGPPRPMRSLECQECDRCGAWCERQKRCAGCKAVSYCDGSCQKAAWKKHKKSCRAAV